MKLVDNCSILDCSHSLLSVVQWFKRRVCSVLHCQKQGLKQENPMHTFNICLLGLSTHSIPMLTMIYGHFSSGEEVISLTTSICVHVHDALRKKVTVLNSFIHQILMFIVIMVGLFPRLRSMNGDLHLFMAFGVGKDYKELSVNSIGEALGDEKSVAPPAFHSYTGADTTSQFHGKGKKSAWEAWKALPSVTATFGKWRQMASSRSPQNHSSYLRDTPAEQNHKRSICQ